MECVKYWNEVLSCSKSSSRLTPVQLWRYQGVNPSNVPISCCNRRGEIATMYTSRCTLTYRQLPPKLRSILSSELPCVEYL